MDTSRRNFLTGISLLAANTALVGSSTLKEALGGRKLRVVMVGTGSRGPNFWGKSLIKREPDLIEYVGLCDINPGRVEYARKYMGVDCPVFTDFDAMIAATRPDLVVVTTTDSTHHEYIIKGLDGGMDVITEKPMTTDEVKCQQILDAERRSGKSLIVGFNYRWSPYPTKVKELLMNNAIGKVTSMDFHYYLNTYHGASYFRRWHGLREMGGTLLVHKATHHFDLVNWWLDSDPEEIFAYGDLEFYGENGPFRAKNCRTCPHTKECKFYYDIMADEHYVNLYVNNEHYDDYIRDSCLFRREINIYDKMSAQIKFANNVVVNYSLTTYGPFEGWRVGINGTEGRIEASLGIPYFKAIDVDQKDLHEIEMDQELEENMVNRPIFLHKVWNPHKIIEVKYKRGGHGGGDERLLDQIFRHPDKRDPFDRAAGSRDGAMSILIGIGARKSIESGEPVRIAELTDLEPRAKRILSI